MEALCEFIINNPTAASNGTVKATLNGKSIESGLKPGLNTLELTSTSAHPTFFDVAWRFQTMENPIAAEHCDLVRVLRAYYRMDPESGDRKRLIEADVLKAGETMRWNSALTHRRSWNIYWPPISNRRALNVCKSKAAIATTDSGIIRKSTTNGLRVTSINCPKEYRASDIACARSTPAASTHYLRLLN